MLTHNTNNTNFMEVIAFLFLISFNNYCIYVYHILGEGRSDKSARIACQRRGFYPGSAAIIFRILVAVEKRL